MLENILIGLFCWIVLGILYTAIFWLVIKSVKK